MAPVAYQNRYSMTDEIKGARMAGDYYLVVSLSPDVAKEFGQKKYGITLRMKSGATRVPSPGTPGRYPTSVPPGTVRGRTTAP